jgi:hypothetical protein
MINQEKIEFSLEEIHHKAVTCFCRKKRRAVILSFTDLKQFISRLAVIQRKMMQKIIDRENTKYE